MRRALEFLAGSLPGLPVGRSAVWAPLLLVCCIGAAVHPVAAQQCPDGTPPPCGPRATARGAAPARNSVAVLYFENLSRDTSDAYLADGLTEELTARLGQVGRLVVTSRAAVRYARAAAASLSVAQLGRVLNATYLLSGSARRAGPHVRVTVELVRAATGERVWGEQYDRENADLLALQEEIARAVATGIAGRLLPAEQRTLAARPTQDPEAFDHYLRGNRLLWIEAEQAVLGAIREYELAIARDPAFGAALGRLAYGYGLALNWAYQPTGLPSDSLLGLGLTTADRAIATDSTVSDAWLGRGLVLFFRGLPGDYQPALRALQRAVALDPRNDAARSTLATILRRLGRFDEAEQEYQRAQAINPARVQAVADLGFLAISRRQYRLAVQLYDRAIALDTTVASSYRFRGVARAALGDHAGALVDAATQLRLSGSAGRTSALLTVAEMTALDGDTAAARRGLDEVLATVGWGRGGSPGVVGVRVGYAVALAAIALGDRELALSALERTRPRGPWLWSYLIFPGFDPIRSDPRFRAVYLEAKPAGAPDPP